MRSQEIIDLSQAISARLKYAIWREREEAQSTHTLNNQALCHRLMDLYLLRKSFTSFRKLTIELGRLNKYISD